MNQRYNATMPHGPFRVLMFDRKPIFRSVFETLGRQYQIASYCTDEMTTAIRLVRSHRPQVALLNLEVPRVDVCAIARDLRLVLRGKPCLMIAVSAWMNELRRRRCAEAEIDLVLIAPIDRSNLKTLLMLEFDLVNRQRYSSCCQVNSACGNLLPFGIGCRSR